MTLTIASNAEDSIAADRMIAHHRAMLDEVRPLVEALLRAVSEGADPQPPREALTQWCRTELLPHAKAEEDVLYPVAGTITPHLIGAMISEHAQLATLIEELETSSHPVRIAAAARALLAVLDSHIAKENEYLLPLLTADATISVSALLDSMHGVLVAPKDDHSCSCQHPPDPLLDARAVPDGTA